ncbi:DUF1765-domain-containing protein [Xylariaceae sp. FL1019]|nr:DUF1765-domain-containing protein [Xylariaceae sp. FL1019]
MTRPTLTSAVSPAVESTQSTPKPPLHSPPEASHPPASPARSLSSSSLHRSWSDKSLPSLPAYAVPAIDFDSDAEFDTTLGSISTPALRDPNEKLEVPPSRQSVGGSWLQSGGMGKRRSILSRPQSWLPSSRSSGELEKLTREESENMAKVEGGSPYLAPNSSVGERSRKSSSSLVSLARRSWLGPSRSPSPDTRQQAPTKPAEVRPRRERAPSNSSVMKLKKATSLVRRNSSSSESSRSTESLSKIGGYLNKIKTKPQSALAKGKAQHDPDSPASSTTSLAPPSTDTRKSHASETSNSTFPDDVYNAGKPPHARDPLWSHFKALETEFQKVQLKPTPLKMNMVRSVLMPFLRNFAGHPSNFNLHHEDLERRVIILNKWWTGLLEMLHVRTHPPVSGVDRPSLLDAITAIMMRTEWRQCSPTFRPFLERNLQERIHRKSTATLTLTNKASSVHSTDSAYMVESTGHNVRNMFTTNLVAQMAIVIEKLSMRTVPNSVVNFAGRACAYAFFFAPGVADVLVRLWSLTPDLLRRVADEMQLPRQNNGESEDIVALFPPGMDQLGWTSVKQMSDALRKAAQPPVALTRISWDGPWVARWNGRDSDMFFIFCKYYYVLADSFMPPGLPLVEKARAPAFVLVNAQVLSVLSSTINRHASGGPMAAPLVPDAFYGADATALALQVAPNNSNILKGMSENRLIVLLKDLLSSDSAARYEEARHTFAEAFMVTMKAAAKRISQYNQNACFTLCDFLEESLLVYHESMENPPIDWSFWFEVCQKILDSGHTISEIRVLSLLFSLWDTIASDPVRKARVLAEWLLTETTFDKLFNHWCPMIRAYFMRLLCWRICRDSGMASESDAKIYLLVFERLKTVWAHYLWLKQDHEERGICLPSTAPCFPTPGKRFMIIRTEVPSAHQGLMIGGFDSSTSLKQDMMGSPATDFDSMTTSPTESVTTKKKWGLLGKVFPFNTSEGTNDLETLRSETAAARAGTASPTKVPSAVPRSAGSDTDSTGSSPTYEATQYVFKFLLSWNPVGTMPPPNRSLSRPRLPIPAQSWISGMGLSGTRPLSSGHPAPTRAVSGSLYTGLIEAAKNAETPDLPSTPTSTTPTPRARRASIAPLSPTDANDDDIPLRDTIGLAKENLIAPIKPTGFQASSVKYSGRALAEWGMVVSECNSFIDRRRDEGVLGLDDVEVPTLGVEAWRKMP